MKKFNKGERTELVSTIRAFDEATRTLDFVVSDQSVDRYDTVVSGWRLDAYVKNPIVLFGHDASSLPIARAIAVNEVDGKLIAKLEFAPAEVYEFADQVFRMITAGYLNAVSAGFIPNDVEYNEEADAFHLRDNELLEISVVPLPANRNALKKAVADGELMLRGMTVPEDEGTPLTPEEEPTVEARAALEAWCTRATEEASVDDNDNDDPPAPELSEAGRAFLAAHLAIRTICRDLGVTPPEDPAGYPDAIEAVTAAHAKAAEATRGAVAFRQTMDESCRALGIDTPTADEEYPTAAEAIVQKIEKAVEAGLDAAIGKLPPVGAPVDTGTTRALRSIMDRAARLAAEG